MIKINHASNWYPDYVSDSVLGINLQELERAGITHIVFDLDKTLVYHGSNTISQEYLNFLKTVRKTGFIIMIGSNTRRDISSLSVLFKSIVVPSGVSYKPFPSFYRKIITETGTSSEHIAMVGDHVLNDVIGGNYAGFTTISVKGLRDKTSPVYRIYLKFALKHSTRST